jgi:hypothetical protein
MEWEWRHKSFGTCFSLRDLYLLAIIQHTSSKDDILYTHAPPKPLTGTVSMIWGSFRLPVSATGSFNNRKDFTLGNENVRLLALNGCWKKNLTKKRKKRAIDKKRPCRIDSRIHDKCCPLIQRFSRLKKKDWSKKKKRRRRRSNVQKESLFSNSCKDEWQMFTNSAI